MIAASIGSSRLFQLGPGLGPVSVYLLIVGVIVAFSIEDFADISMMAMQGGRPANASWSNWFPLLTTMGFCCSSSCPC